MFRDASCSMQIKGQAPPQGLASSVYKQIADGPVQVRKLIQTLSAEIQATKKAAKVSRVIS